MATTFDILAWPNLPPRSVLIVTEAFLEGGLETHITGQVRAFRRLGVGTHLAIGERFHATGLPPEVDTVRVGLPMKPAMTHADLLKSIDALREIIRRNSVQAVHAHPYLSLLPAFFGAALEGVPFAVTIHGPNALQNAYGEVFGTFLREAALPMGGLVVAVSRELADLVTKLAPASRLAVIPNGVDTQPTPDSPATGDCWLIAGRLDEYKAPGMLDFIRKASAAGVPRFLLAGDGPRRTWLQRQLEAERLENSVRFLGWVDDLRDVMRGCAGVAGMGRVVLEGIAANRPVILTGYDGVKGLVDREFLASAAYANFSGRSLRTIDAETLRRHLALAPQLDLQGLRATVASHYDEITLWTRFLQLVSGARVLPNEPFTAFYRRLAGEAGRHGQGVLESESFLNILSQLVSITRNAQTAGADSTNGRCCISSALPEDFPLKTPAIYAARSSRRMPLSNTMAGVGKLPAFMKGGNQGRDGASEAVRKEPKEKEQMSGSATAQSIVRLAAAAPNLVRSFLEVQRDRGFREACLRTTLFLQGRLSPERHSLRSCPATTATYRFLRANLQCRLAAPPDDLPAGRTRNVYEQITRQTSGHRRAAVIVVANAAEWSSRHREFCRSLAADGYFCIVLNVAETAPYCIDHDSELLETNCAEAVVRSLRGEAPLVVAASPLAEIVIRCMSPSMVIYDAICDPLAMPIHCGPMKQDHERLLESAGLILFPDECLRDAYGIGVKGECLVLRPEAVARPGPASGGDGSEKTTGEGRGEEFTVGYCGALNEAVDWSLLQEVVERPGWRLMLIGPLSREPASRVIGARLWRMESVLESAQTTRVEPSSTDSCTRALQLCHALIQPRAIGEVTEHAAYVKAYDLVESGAMVFAIESNAARRLAADVPIEVEPREGLLARLDELAERHFSGGGLSPGERVSIRWDKAMEPVMAAVRRRTAEPSQPARGAEIIDIVNMTYFDWEGKAVYKGGAERYVYDLARLLMSEGKTVRVVQAARRDFENDYHGVKVRGVRVNCDFYFEPVSKELDKACREASVVIASPVELASHLSHRNVIGINHGIHWDDPFNSVNRFQLKRYRGVFRALRNCQAVVAVDTNFINWLRTYDHALTAKVSYIPNYVDTEVFRPAEKRYDGEIRCLYPRRLYEARGLYVTMEAFERLFRRYEGVTLHFVGQADSPADAERVREFLRRHGARVTWEELDMNEMHKAYEQSHIVLVPTMYSEGTSLSCLEGMATGNAVVTTTVGGLPNLVMDGFNGVLVRPDAVELSRAIERLVEEPQRIQKMARAGLELASAFNKAHWDDRWRSLMRELSLR